MDQEQELTGPGDASENPARPVSRRQLLKLGLGGLGCVTAGTAAYGYLKWRAGEVLVGAEVFKNDAPSAEVWRQWESHGWVREAYHYRKLGRNVQCVLCPNSCILEPGDRSHCRNRVNRDGTLYTMAYANPCSMHVDPIEKKPLFHFLPTAAAFSLATSGCGFRCLNCQNWEISQRKPEETKNPGGQPLRLRPQELDRMSRGDLERLTMTPEDVVAAAAYFQSATIAYTYSEPIVWYEYMLDTAKIARAKGIKNVWVTCGYMQREALDEFCRYLDAAAINLKSFSDDVYRDLNSGRLQPVLDTLKMLKREGVWFEVINLIVPTYTDKPDMIRTMCDWLVDNLGPDYPLHFSRFHPDHKLERLPPTPPEILSDARDIATRAGLRYVYIGNTPETSDNETTWCPKCKNLLVDRFRYTTCIIGLRGGVCTKCGEKIPGVWA